MHYSPAAYIDGNNDLVVIAERIMADQRDREALSHLLLELVHPALDGHREDAGLKRLDKPTASAIIIRCLGRFRLTFAGSNRYGSTFMTA